MHTVKTDLYRAVCSLGFSLAVVATVLVLLGTAWQEVGDALERGRLYAGFAEAAVLDALAGDTFSLVLPVLSPLPYSGIWMEEWSSGYLKAYLPRTTRRQYLGSKFLACVCSGGLSVTAGLLCAYVLVSLGLKFWALGNGDLSLLPLTGCCLRLFCSGGLWASIGLALSAWWESSAMSYGGPFVVYYVLTIFYERYFDAWFVLSPIEWLIPGEGWPFRGWSVVVLVGCLILGMAALFAAQAGRRLKEL